MRLLNTLMDEHRGFSAMLDVLDGVADRLGRGVDVPMDMVADVLDFFENFTDPHHGREETMLFPLLAQHGIGPDQTVVSALLAQHEAGRAYGAKMRVGLKRLRQGDPGAADSLASDARGYTELIREHIRIEEQYFYQFADQVLTDAEHTKVVEQFEDSAGSRAAHAARARYLRMIDVYPAVVAGWKASA